MRVKCEFCDNYIEDTDFQCPHCGAPNEHMARSAVGVPKTIEELKAFAVKHNLPLDKMRVFIGEDYRGARAFGIYKDAHGNFIVYKNKNDGSRAVRYEGTDEAYAVNELYQKMKSEVANQKALNPNAVKKSHGPGTKGPIPPNRTAVPQKKRGRGCCIIPLLVLVGLFVFGFIYFNYIDKTPDKGYYRYAGSTYYFYNDDWYLYDDYLDDWVRTNADPDLQDNYSDYYSSGYYSSDYGTTNFTDSSYYTPSYSGGGTYDDDNGWTNWDDDDDWDDYDWDWDSGWDSDWDSGYTDWDSDW